MQNKTKSEVKLKSRFAKPVGFGVQNIIKGKTFSGKAAGFDPGRFKTQHKG